MLISSSRSQLKYNRMIFIWILICVISLNDAFLLPGNKSTGNDLGMLNARLNSVEQLLIRSENDKRSLQEDVKILKEAMANISSHEKERQDLQEKVNVLKANISNHENETLALLDDVKRLNETVANLSDQLVLERTLRNKLEQQMEELRINSSSNENTDKQSLELLVRDFQQQIENLRNYNNEYSHNTTFAFSSMQKQYHHLALSLYDTNAKLDALQQHNVNASSLQLQFRSLALSFFELSTKFDSLKNYNSEIANSFNETLLYINISLLNNEMKMQNSPNLCPQENTRNGSCVHKCERRFQTSVVQSLMNINQTVQKLQTGISALNASMENLSQGSFHATKGGVYCHCFLSYI